MELLNLIAHLRGDAHVAELAQEIADRCEDGVRARVVGRIELLGMAEARGYIRARSAAVIRPEVESVLKTARDVKTAWRGQLTEKASEEIVRRLLWEELGRRRHTKPQRRAA